MASKTPKATGLNSCALSHNAGQLSQCASEIPEPPAPEMIPAGEPGTQRKLLNAAITLPFVTVCGLAFGFTAGMLCLVLLLPNAPSTRDYIIYWATGQQLTHHANPYDPVAATQLERSAGLPANLNPGLMRNPPWALPLVFPLGYLSLRAGWVLWALMLLACLVVSVHLLWILYGRPRNRRVLLGYSFGPALLCLLFGQTSLFALLGLVLFLRLHRTHPMMAGISLWLCALKPHLFLPFGMVLVAWVLVFRCYKLLAGAAIAMAASCAITLAIDPLAWTQYLQMARSSGIEREYIPCLSFLLRDWLSPHSIWLQYLPAAVGCVWALAYFWPRRHAWDWMKNGSPLMLVSVLVAPYSWIYDQGLVIPALLQGAFLARFRSLLIALAFLSALVEIALFRSLSHPTALAFWTYWAAPAWLVWYLVALTPSTSWARAWSALRTMKWIRICMG
ncbi:MAG: glycosyltransferase 87 family protein [Terracidiphilus sp.]